MVDCLKKSLTIKQKIIKLAVENNNVNTGSFVIPNISANKLPTKPCK